MITIYQENKTVQLESEAPVKVNTWNNRKELDERILERLHVSNMKPILFLKLSFKLLYAYY